MRAHHRQLCSAYRGGGVCRRLVALLDVIRVILRCVWVGRLRLAPSPLPSPAGPLLRHGGDGLRPVMRAWLLDFGAEGAYDCQAQ